MKPIKSKYKAKVAKVKKMKMKTKRKHLPKKSLPAPPEPVSDSEENEDDSTGELDIKNDSDEGLLPPNKSDDEFEQGSDEDLNIDNHRKSLEKLKKTDPDFYDFLEQNDKNLLNFELDSDSEKEDGDKDDDDDNVHKLSELHVNSDESDFEPEDGKKGDHRKITLKMVSDWQGQLQAPKVTNQTIRQVISAFNAAMLRVDSDSKKREKGVYKVEGSSVFNAVIQMCVLNLQPALKKYLGMEQSSKDPQKCKHFVKIKTDLIAYFTDLIQLLQSVSSANIVTVLLKHLHSMSPFVACFGRISKQILKKVILLWSTGEETVRVVAFLCILRITRNHQATLLDRVLKNMYMVYVKNCKFVSPSTWPGINFMRRSLVEMFSLDLNVSYQHVFLYIRQLAIHLRTAIVVQKIESRQAVYNWQYVNCMHLWADLLGATCNKPQLQPLIYPLVMIITNAIKLVPTKQYYPLRFHCVEILIKLSKDSETFIPILPFILEVLTGYDFNKRNKIVSMKPLDFSCILRLSKSQLTENGFKDALIEKIYSCLLEYSANESHFISFPDINILTIMQIKQFLKKCNVANYTKKIRQLLDKIEENGRFIEKERKKVSFALSEIKLIAAWETNIKNKGTPLSTFYDNWFKINRLQKRKNITKNEEMVEDIPVLKKVKKADAPVKKQNEGPVELFPSDSEDEKVKFDFGSDGGEKEEKPKKKKKHKKKATKRKTREDSDDQVADEDDVVEDFNVKDW